VARVASPAGDHAEIVEGEDWVRPERGVASGLYRGRLIILVDGGCASYCEDFVMPFKDNQRATVIGDTTAGTYAQTHFTTFDYGMELNIAATRMTFPDGRPFEGVGIAPDIVIEPTVDAIRSHDDVALTRALEILEGRSR
jgi:carboxyl-terminal processing protease